MTEIVPYSEEYEEKLSGLDETVYREVRDHGDVLKTDIGVALTDGVVSGVCYLRRTPSFQLLKKRLPKYFLTGVFLAAPGSSEEVEASVKMLFFLQDRYENYQKKYPKKRIILRLWCRASDRAYAELLLSAGFRAMEIMPEMRRELSEADVLEALPGGTSLPEKDSAERAETIFLPAGLTFEEPVLNEAFLKEYSRVNGEAFGLPDSTEELRFVLQGGGRLFTVMKGKELIASVTTWKLTEDTAATENIFCAEAYREQGITTALLKKVFSGLFQEGYKKVSLSLFGDNQPAFQLYEKLGYEVSDMLMEMHYETSYEMREY